MLTELVDHISQHTGMPSQQSRASLGVVLNAAERQGANFAREIYERVPGARTLAARMGDEVGGSTGVVARLIEKTPGGQLSVMEDMFRSLREQGLSIQEVGALFPAIESFAESEFGISGFGHLGDILGRTDAATENALLAG